MESDPTYSTCTPPGGFTDPLLPDGPLLVHDWTILIGARVKVLHENQVVREGQVEAVTPDGRAAWLSQGEGFGRQLFDKGSGYQLIVPLEQFHALGRKHQ